MPVINAEGRVLGVVSERDIIVKCASHGVGAIGRIWTPADVDERRLTATTAGEAMTAPAVTIAPDRPVAEAAWLMVERNVNRLPVVRDHRLVGIVSRADLVRAFTRPDGEIWEDLQRDLGGSEFWRTPAVFDVSGGRVRVSGHVEAESDSELVEAVVWRVPGVVSVDLSGVEWERHGAVRSAVR